MTNLEKAKEWLFNLHVDELQRIYSILKEDIDVNIISLSDFETLLLYNLRDSDMFKPKLNINLEHHSSLLVDFENPLLSIEEEADNYSLETDNWYISKKAFIVGAKSESAKQYWYNQFKQQN